MDINTAIARMRELADVANQHFDAGQAVPSSVAINMATVWEAIDGWMSKGGFKPDAWAWITDAKS